MLTHLFRSGALCLLICIWLPALGQKVEMRPCYELLDTLGMSFAKPRFSNSVILLKGIRIALNSSCQNGAEPLEMMSEAIWEAMARYPDEFLQMLCSLDSTERFWMSKYGSRSIHDGFPFDKIKSNMQARLGRYECARLWYNEIKDHLPKD
jgi:hypothetical protein